jgi:hypothetical protein
MEKKKEKKHASEWKKKCKKNTQGMEKKMQKQNILEKLQ